MEEVPKRRRRPPKRFHGLDQGDEVPNVRTNNSVTKPRRKKAGVSIDPDLTEEADYGSIDVEEPEVDQRTVSSSKGQVKVMKSKGFKGDGPPRKKARKVVVSDSEEDNYLEAEAVPEEEDFDEDDQVSSEEEKSRGAKGKGKVLAGRGKKRKAKGDSVSSPQPPLERSVSSDLLSNKKTKPRKLDESFLEGEVASTADFSAKTSPAELKADSPVPQLKKLKLPVIKKNKPQGTTDTSTPTSATPATKPRLPLDIISAGGSKQSEIRKAQMVASDLDLSNKSIYQELFKTSVDGGVPRTGLNRRAKEEERRKELNKMKEDYLAKRAREGHSFDLQARPEKIARFEDKLRYIRSTALCPNYLAAKWKEVYEKEKRRQKGQHEWNEDGSANGREEGEVK